MMVVSSLVTVIRRARPSWSRVMLSSFNPSSAETTSPPVRMAMSPSVDRRRSPNPGALTATAVKVPRSLLTTSVARASPSTSSATMSNGLLVAMTFSSTGNSSCTELIFWLASRM